jgi:hypothetical protein
MALKYQIEKLEDVEEPLRQHYVPAGEGGKGFLLATTSEHPKVSEFRTSNVDLLKERDALKAKLEANPPADVAKLQNDLATVQKKADRALLREKVLPKALAAGALPNAVDLVLQKMEEVFEVKGDAVVAKPNTFSKTKPSELLTPEEWIEDATRSLSFLFKPSGGGGGRPGSSGGGSKGNVLRNPTANDLGDPRNAALIASGKLRVEYD